MTHVRFWMVRLLAIGAILAMPNTMMFARETAPAPFAGLSFAVKSATVPPGGMYQLQLMLTEPKPMGVGSSALDLTDTVFGTTVGASVNSASGQSCGVLVRRFGGFDVMILSPDGMLGTNATYPILTMTFPVRSDAPVGLTLPVTMNLAGSMFLSPLGEVYPLEATPGRLTIGHTLSINDVLPGGGVIAAGSPITILGFGFTPNVRVQIEGAQIATTQVLSPNRIDVTLPTDLQLTGARVRVSTPTETSNYFSYARTADVGRSARALLAAADPMFSQLTYTTASLTWKSGGSAFTGVALQNTSFVSADVSIDVVSPSDEVLETTTLTVPSRSKLTRDLLDFFPSPPAGSAGVRIRSSRPIQMLGLLGDDAASTLVPIVVSVP